jgi:hypothetical protein
MARTDTRCRFIKSSPGTPERRRAGQLFRGVWPLVRRVRACSGRRCSWSAHSLPRSWDPSGSTPEAAGSTLRVWRTVRATWSLRVPGSREVVGAGTLGSTLSPEAAVPLGRTTSSRPSSLRRVPVAGRVRRRPRGPRPPHPNRRPNGRPCHDQNTTGTPPRPAHRRWHHRDGHGGRARHSRAARSQWILGVRCRPGRAGLTAAFAVLGVGVARRSLAAAKGAGVIAVLLVPMAYVHIASAGPDPAPIAATAVSLAATVLFIALILVIQTLTAERNSARGGRYVGPMRSPEDPWHATHWQWPLDPGST